ncbi:hypothetical protein Tco_1394321 [Tanacetum coccineum]
MSGLCQGNGEHQKPSSQFNKPEIPGGSGRKYHAIRLWTSKNGPKCYDSLGLLRQFVYIKILEITARSDGNPTGYEHCLTPRDRWSKRENKTDVGRYVASLRD